MRLAIIDHHANVGGGRRFSGTLVREIAALRPWWEIRLVTSRQALENHWLGDLAPNIETYGLVNDETTRRWLSNGRFLGIPGSWRAKELLRRTVLDTYFRRDRDLARGLRGADVAYFPWLNYGQFIACDMPVVVTVHDLLWKHIDVLTSAERTAVEQSLPKWLAASDAVVTSSNFMRGEIERFYPNQAKRVEVVHLPPGELPSPLPKGQRQALLSKWEINKPYALCPAGLWEHKNHRNLVLAFAELKRREKKLQLICTGSYTDQAFAPLPPEELWQPARALRKLAQDHGLSLGQEIVGLGHISDMELATLYSEAACVVMPVLYEAGSFPILEAAAHGVRIVCSDIPVYREQAQLFGLRPIFFDPTQSISIADALEFVEQTDPSQEELTETASFVRARSWNEVAREYLMVIESLS